MEIGQYTLDGVFNTQREQLYTEVRRKIEINTNHDKETDVFIDYRTLARTEKRFADELISDPSHYLPIISGYLTRLQKTAVANDSAHYERIRVRVAGIQPATNFPRAELTGKLVCVCGTIGAISELQLAFTRIAYECHAKSGRGICGKSQTFEQKNIECAYQSIRSPQVCANRRCGSTKFDKVAGSERMCNFRQFKLVKTFAYGMHANDPDSIGSMRIDAYGSIAIHPELVAGNIVFVVGVVATEQPSAQEGDLMCGRLFIHANNIIRAGDFEPTANSITELATLRTGKSDPEWLAYILSRTCRNVYGMIPVKHAICLMMAMCSSEKCISGNDNPDASASSSSSENSDMNVHMDTFKRRTPHVLIRGDSHIGKTALIQYAANSCRKSVFISASSTTIAGLTFAKARSSKMSVEPGALVNASGGICCIDNMHVFNEKTIDSMKDAMETQRVIGTFGSGQTEMPTVCSVFAAAKVDTRNKKFATPLLSRFDLILDFISDSNSKFREVVAAHMLRNLNDVTLHDDIKFIKAFFEHITSRAIPVIGNNAKVIIEEYFSCIARERQRRELTNRFLDSLVRLSVANARLMGHPTVTMYDAMVVIDLVNRSLLEIPVSMTVLADDPNADYADMRSRVLRELNLGAVQRN